MELIIVLIVIFIVYLFGYLAGYRQCEDATQKVINQIMEECEEKKVHKIQEPNTLERSVENGSKGVFTGHFLFR